MSEIRYDHSKKNVCAALGISPEREKVLDIEMLRIIAEINEDRYRGYSLMLERIEEQANWTLIEKLYMAWEFGMTSQRRSRPKIDGVEIIGPIPIDLSDIMRGAPSREMLEKILEKIKEARDCEHCEHSEECEEFREKKMKEQPGDWKPPKYPCRDDGNVEVRKKDVPEKKTRKSKE